MSEGFGIDRQAEAGALISVRSPQVHGGVELVQIVYHDEAAPIVFIQPNTSSTRLRRFWLST